MFNNQRVTIPSKSEIPIFRARSESQENPCFGHLRFHNNCSERHKRGWKPQNLGVDVVDDEDTHLDDLDDLVGMPWNKVHNRAKKLDLPS